MKVNEIAAAIHKKMCEDSRFGYSWSERFGATNETWTIDGEKYTLGVGDYDCSSSVITAWKLALSHTKYAGKLDGATYTGNMRSVFTASGLFTWKPMSFTAQTGDVYLNEANHTAMCQSAVPDMLSEFCINENGEVYGGKRGDQTGDESHVAAYYDYPWDGILHYNGKADGTTGKQSGASSAKSSSKVAAGSSSQPRYRVMANFQWLDEMRGKTDTGGSNDDFAGIKGAAIQYFACDCGKYRARNGKKKWLAYVSKYDTGDLDYGCAGDGSAITGIQIKNSKVKYRVHMKGGKWGAWKTNGQTAGNAAIDMIQIIKA